MISKPSIHQSGPLDTVASMGDLKAREELLARQRKLRRERSMEKGLKVAGDVLTVATKLSGLSSSSSSKQSGLMLSAVSAGLNLGSNVMKDNNRKNDDGGGRPAPVVVTPQHHNGESPFQRGGLMHAGEYTGVGNNMLTKAHSL